MLQGKEMGIMPPVQRFGRLAATRSAEQFGLGSLSSDDADEVTLLAWSWLIANAEAVSAVKRTHGITLLYEQVAADPTHHIRQLFEDLALGWPRQTETFLNRSQESQGDYYSVYRNSHETAERWRNELDQGAIGKIREIVQRHPVGSQFF